MMEKDPIKNDARKAKREMRLGKDAKCAWCGISNLESLTLEKRSLIENHHVVGRANDADLVIPLCRNCHGVATEKSRQTGVSMKKPETVLHKTINVLRALGAFFSHLAQKCCEWASELSAFILALDKKHPDWAVIPEAQP